MSHPPPSNGDLNRTPTGEDLDRLQLTTLLYYLHESNPANGLVRDKTDPDGPASIAATGLALASIPVLVERGVISREFAPEIALRLLRFFRDSPQGQQPGATGYKGFYYHFLHIKTGRRVWECELSTIDSAFLFAGMLTCAAHFDAETEDEVEVRRLADELYRRADWQWALNGGAALSHGWRPESGFIPHTWRGCTGRAGAQNGDVGIRFLLDAERSADLIDHILVETSRTLLPTVSSPVDSARCQLASTSPPLRRGPVSV